jgi:hypothetical protein
MKNALKAGLVAGGMLATQAGAQAAEPFRLTSPGLQDNGVLAQKYGGVSDAAGSLGQGSDHWIAYGIPANVLKFDEGQVTKPLPFVVGGKNTANSGVYQGPCPGPGTGYHHYLFTMVATDLEPGALPPDLTRTDLIKAFAGHGKAVTDLVLRFAFPE